MLLFKKAFWDGLQTGAITLTFRRWAKPHVKPGGRYRCHPIGVLEVDAIAKVTASGITEDDARRAGFPSRDVLRSYLAELGPIEDTTELWRIEPRELVGDQRDVDLGQLVLEREANPIAVTAGCPTAAA